MTEEDLNSEESWARARYMASVLNPIPPSLSSAATQLWSTPHKSGEPIPSDCYDSIKLLEKSSMLTMPLFFAATALYPDKVRDQQQDNMCRAVLDVLEPRLFATLLGMVYFHRRLNKLAASNPDWEKLSKEAILNMELGFIVGSCSAKIGPAIGALVAATRYFALATLMLKNPKDYSKYRIHKKKVLDIMHERSIWGCDHAQVASVLISSIGLQKELFDMSESMRVSGRLPISLPPQFQPWWGAMSMVEQIKDGKPFAAEHDTAKKLGISAQVFAEIKSKVDLLLQGKSNFTWFFKKSKEEPASPAPTS